MPWGSPAASLRASSSISPMAAGPSGSTPAGRPSRVSAPRCWRNQALPDRFRSSKVRTDFSRLSRRTRNPITANSSTPSAPTTWSMASRSSRAHAPDLVAMAEKISYVIDPDNPYPNRYTGRITVTVKDGRVIEKSRPNFRGGAHLPLSDDELTQKYRDNCRYGGWDDQRIATVERAVAAVAAGGKIDISAARS